jgi:hypothetical protein
MDIHHRKHMSRDSHPASPLARWLNLQKTRHVIVKHFVVSSPRMFKLHGHKENTATVLLAVCVLPAVPSMDLHVAVSCKIAYVLQVKFHNFTILYFYK